jgi:hypothetical protein
MTAKIPIGVGWFGTPVEIGARPTRVPLVGRDALLGDGHDDVHRPLRDRLLVLSRPLLPFDFLPRQGRGSQLATAVLVAWTIEKIVALGGGWRG